MSLQERTHIGTCKRCGTIIYAAVSVEIGLCGMCHRFLREIGMPSKLLYYLLSRDGEIDWERQEMRP